MPFSSSTWINIHQKMFRYSGRLILFWTISLIVLLNSRAIASDTWSSNGTTWNWLPFAYDDSYITKHLDDRYPYLKLENGSYIAPRDYFNFSHLHEPTRDHLERVNLEQHLYEEIKSMEISSSIATMDQWHYTNEKIERDHDGEADEENCLKELKYLANQVHQANLNSSHLFQKGYKYQQLLKLLDSWGRPPSETYFGNSYWTGSYRGCKSVSLDDTGKSSHRYCWAKIGAKDWPDKDEIIPPTSIRVGACLPRSCNTKLANQHKQMILDIMKFNFSPMHRDRYNKIIHVYCLPLKTPNELKLNALLFYIVATNWIVLLCLLSMFASYVGKENLPAILYNLTIQANYRRFVADDEPRDNKKLVDLRPMGVARFVATVAVCLGHCLCTFGWISYSSSFNIMIGRKPVHFLLLPTLKSNDIFWLIGGLLTSYTILNRFTRDELLKPQIYLATILARYLRLAGMQVVVLSFMKAVYISLGEGPFWDYGTYKYSLQGQCQQSSWWRVLLIPILFNSSETNSYKHECLPVTWHIVADMKLSLLAPLIIYLMTSKSATRRWLVMAIISLVSIVVQYRDLSMQQVIYFKQFFKYNQSVGVNMLTMAFDETGFFNILTRLFPLSVGMLAGIYLREHKKWPYFMKGWPFFALIGYQIYDWCVPALSQFNYLNYGLLPSEETIKLALLLKPRLDSIMFAIIIVRMSSDLAPKVMSHAKSFYKLSKLSYCVLLVHPIVIGYLVSADESSRMNMFGSQLFRLILCCVSLSYLIAFPLYILFESPIASLTGALFERRRKLPTELKKLQMKSKTN